MAKRKLTIPVAVLVGMAAGVMTPRPGRTKNFLDYVKLGWWDHAFNHLKSSYLGISDEGKLDLASLNHGLLPLIAGLLVHKFVGGAPLNVNRTLASAGVPIIRI